MIAFAKEFSRQVELRQERGHALAHVLTHVLTLTDAGVSVKNPHVLCLCNRQHPARPSASSATRLLEGISGLALLGRAVMPLRVGVMRSAEPLPAALAILLSAFVAGFLHTRDSLTDMFLGLCGYSRHRYLLSKCGCCQEGFSVGRFHDANFVHSTAR